MKTMLQTELFAEEAIEEAIHIESDSLSLSERIQNERIAKQPSQPFSIKQLSKMKIRYDLSIQRNIRWSDEQATKLIESCFLGFPIPPVYALKTPDKELWLLDGKQRLTKLTTFIRDEWSLTECNVYGIDVIGLTFSQLPEELQELVTDQYINVIQFDSLTTEQRDSLFQRLNSGTSLSSVEYIRSVLGSDMLDYIGKLTDKPLFRFMNADKFVDDELSLQIIGIVTSKMFEFNKTNMTKLAIDLRINGLDENVKDRINSIVDYISLSFANLSEKEQKAMLKKNDIIGLVGAANNVMDNIDCDKFGNITTLEIVKKSGAYQATKVSGSAKEANVKKRIAILTELF